MRALIPAAVAALLTLAGPARASSEAAPYLEPKWSFSGPFGTFDRAAAQRGFQVYKEVCASCHSMRLLSYRNLSGIGLNQEQIAQIAASYTVSGGLDDSGQPVDRPGLPSDRFHSPFPNDKAARAANGGALPPDQSLIVKAREDGSDYIYSLLQGYKEPPEGVKIPDGQYYNIYFPGHLLAMPQPLRDDQVTYADGTKATVQQMSYDVTTFLTWAANPEMENRKQMGVKIVLFLTLMTGLTYAVKRKVWSKLHH